MLQQELKAQTDKAHEDLGMIIIYSTSKGEIADDGPPGDHSPFAKAILATLPRLKGDIDEFYGGVNAAMKQAAAEPSKTADDKPSNITIIRDRPASATRRKAQTPNMERIGSPPSFYFNDPSQDQEIGIMRILIIDSPRDEPGVTKIASR